MFFSFFLLVIGSYSLKITLKSPSESFREFSLEPAPRLVIGLKWKISCHINRKDNWGNMKIVYAGRILRNDERIEEVASENAIFLVVLPKNGGNETQERSSVETFPNISAGYSIRVGYNVRAAARDTLHTRNNEDLRIKTFMAKYGSAIEDLEILAVVERALARVFALKLESLDDCMELIYMKSLIMDQCMEDYNMGGHRETISKLLENVVRFRIMHDLELILLGFSKLLWIMSDDGDQLEGLGNLWMEMEEGLCLVGDDTCLNASEMDELMGKALEPDRLWHVSNLDRRLNFVRSSLFFFESMTAAQKFTIHTLRKNHPDTETLEFRYFYALFSLLRYDVLSGDVHFTFSMLTTFSGYALKNLVRVIRQNEIKVKEMFNLNSKQIRRLHDILDVIIKIFDAMDEIDLPFDNFTDANNFSQLKVLLRKLLEQKPKSEGDRPAKIARMSSAIFEDEEAQEALETFGLEKEEVSRLEYLVGRMVEFRSALFQLMFGFVLSEEKHGRSSNKSFVHIWIQDDMIFFHEVDTILDFHSKLFPNVPLEITEVIEIPALFIEK